MKKTKEELLEIRGNLFKEQKSLDMKFGRNSKALRMIEKEESKNIIETIPDDINKVTKKQWNWILYHYHDCPEGQYEFSTDFLYKKLGIHTSGFNPDTKQFSFNLLYSYRIKFFESAQFLVKKLEKGLCFNVHGINEEYAPRAFYDKKTKHITIQDYPYKGKKFKSLKSFQNWYEEISINH